MLSEKALAFIPDQVLSYVSPTAAATKKKNVRNAKRAAKASAKGKKAPAPAPEPVEPGVLRLRGQKAKYQVSDITGRIAERQNVTLSVGWNVQPWVGALWWSPGTGAALRTAGAVVRSEAFDFPALKETKKAETSKASS